MVGIKIKHVLLPKSNTVQELRNCTSRALFFGGAVLWWSCSLVVLLFGREREFVVAPVVVTVTFMLFSRGFVGAVISMSSSRLVC